MEPDSKKKKKIVYRRRRTTVHTTTANPSLLSHRSSVGAEGKAVAAISLYRTPGYSIYYGLSSCVDNILDVFRDKSW